MNNFTTKHLFSRIAVFVMFVSPPCIDYLEESGNACISKTFIWFDVVHFSFCCSFSVIFSLRASMLINLNLNLCCKCHYHSPSSVHTAPSSARYKCTIPLWSNFIIKHDSMIQYVIMCNHNYMLYQSINQSEQFKVATARTTIGGSNSWWMLGICSLEQVRLQPVTECM